jgi:glutamate-1-semialdehyde 2,1-aminomutase
MRAGQTLYERARQIIPGGTQLLSKRPEMFLPGEWPAYYSRSKGVEVWDLDGRRYLDFATSAIGAAVLGVGDPDVDAAVIGSIQRGSVSTLNCPEEVELAELLTELHPWAAMARFARGGGEAMALAVRIARAAAGKDVVAFCGYHGWHDWYIAANLVGTSELNSHLLPGLEPAGVPQALHRSVVPFRYNNFEDLQGVVKEHGSAVGAIVMEPTRNTPPAPGFLEAVRDAATRLGAVLIFDEVTSGWRETTGGIHLRYGVSPDIAVFAKALGNGYAISAVIGIREVMEAAQRSFISSTAWTERIGPTAALATIKKHRENSVHEHLCEIGHAVRKVWMQAAAEAGIGIKISGIPALSHLEFESEPLPSMTLFTQGMLDRGFLAGSAFYSTFSHTPENVQQYASAVADVFGIIAKAVTEGNVQGMLRGGVKHSGFQRLT